MTGRPLFVLTLRPARDIDPVIALRLLLEDARRRGLRCTAITTTAPSDDPLLLEPGAELRVASERRVATHSGRKYGK